MKKQFLQIGCLLAMSLALLVLVSCATSPGKNLNKISVGMTKAQVIEAMGQPTSTTAQNGAEVLRYSLNATRALFSVDFDDYSVRLVEGKVVSYGKTSELEKGTGQTRSSRELIWV
jgi:hypothetical protein